MEKIKKEDIKVHIEKKVDSRYIGTITIRNKSYEFESDYVDKRLSIKSRNEDLVNKNASILYECVKQAAIEYDNEV